MSDSPSSFSRNKSHHSLTLQRNRPRLPQPAPQELRPACRGLCAASCSASRPLAARNDRQGNPAHREAMACALSRVPLRPPPVCTSIASAHRHCQNFFPRATPPKGERHAACLSLRPKWAFHGGKAKHPSLARPPPGGNPGGSMAGVDANPVHHRGWKRNHTAIW